MDFYTGLQCVSRKGIYESLNGIKMYLNYLGTKAV